MHYSAAYLVYSAFNGIKTIYLIYMSVVLKKKVFLLFIIFLIIIHSRKFTHSSHLIFGLQLMASLHLNPFAQPIFQVPDLKHSGEIGSIYKPHLKKITKNTIFVKDI
jgi:hypothetical protein